VFAREEFRPGFYVFLLYFLVSCLLHYRMFADGILIAPYNDALAHNYPLKHLYSGALKGFEFPFWNPYQFAGIPFLGEIQNGALYPLNMLFYLALPAPHAYNLSYILHFALGCGFTYMYLGLLGIRRLPAFLGGLVFGFSGFMVVNKDHTAIVNSAVYLPLMMYFLERLRRTLAVRYLLLIGLTVGVQIFAGSPQMCFYTGFVAALFVLYTVLRMRDLAGLRFLVYWSSGVILGVVIALPQLFPAYELNSLSWMNARKLYLGFDYFAAYHVYLESLVTIFMPGVLDAVAPEDSVPIILGSLPVALAAAVLIKGWRSDLNIRFWGIVGIIGLLFSLGVDTPLGKVIYHMPGFSLFRVLGRNLFEFTFAVAVLFGIGIDKVLYEKHGGYLKLAFASMLAAGIFSSLAVVLVHEISLEPYLSWRLYQHPHLFNKNVSFSNKLVYVPLGLILLYMGWMVLYSRFRNRVLRYMLAILLLAEVYVIGGFGGISGPGLSDVEDLCSGEPVYELSLQAPVNNRVVDMVPRQLWYEVEKFNPLANITCGVSSLAGYDPLVPERYADLMRLWVAGLSSLSWDYLIRNNLILSMQGGKYLRVYKGIDVSLEKARIDNRRPMPVMYRSLEWDMLQNASKRGGNYVLYSPEGGLGIVFRRISLGMGTYVVTFSARVEGELSGSMALYLYPEPEIKQMNRFEDFYANLLVPADWLKGDFREFSKIISIDEDGIYILMLMTRPGNPVEVTKFSLVLLEHYNPPPIGAAGLKRGTPVYERLGDEGLYETYVNRNALPRAWSVESLVPVSGFDEVLMRLDHLWVNPAREAMLKAEDIERIGRRTFSVGEVAVEDLGLNHVRISADFPGEGFLVLSDQHYPGWKAYVDGRETEIYEVNGIQRGVVVPEGRHNVEFRYRPVGFLPLMALSCVLIVGIMFHATRSPGSSD
jgi:hypothetical protein